jgi:hypothetical protein
MALFALLAAGAAALTGLGSARLEPGLPFTSALVAVADLAATALLAGSGLLAASWTGVGAAVGELVGGSTGNLVAFVVLVAGIDLLLLSLLRRRPRLAESGARPLAEPTSRRPRREG